MVHGSFRLVVLSKIHYPNSSKKCNYHKIYIVSMVMRGKIVRLSLLCKINWADPGFHFFFQFFGSVDLNKVTEKRINALRSFSARILTPGGNSVRGNSIQCCNCGVWFHCRCTSLSTTELRRLKKGEWTCGCSQTTPTRTRSNLLLSQRRYSHALWTTIYGRWDATRLKKCSRQLTRAIRILNSQLSMRKTANLLFWTCWLSAAKTKWAHPATRSPLTQVYTYPIRPVSPRNTNEIS